MPLLISEMSEVELKSRVVQLETELEQERAKSKQLQNEKVTELEAIQEAARRHIEELKRSFEDEKQDQVRINIAYIRPGVDTEHW